MTKTLPACLLAAALAAGAALPAAAQSDDCDRACLEGLAEAYMAALVAQDYAGLPWSQPVRYTESGVPLMIGEALWGSISAASDDPLIIADASTGEVVWYGIVEEHGLPAYYAMRLRADGARIAEVETLLGRRDAPIPHADTAGYSVAALAAAVPRDERTGRRRMRRLVRDYFDTREQNDGEIETRFADDCTQVLNGVSLTDGEHWAAQAAEGCEAQYAIGVWRPVDRIRDRRTPVVDVERGLVAAISYEDHAARYVTYETNDGRELSIPIAYPNSRGLFEIFKIVDGEITRIEGVSTFLPYYMRSVWTE